MSFFPTTAEYEAIKAGDSVIYYTGGIGRTGTIMTVARVTKTQIVTTGDRRFNRQRGTAVGGYHGGHIRPATETQLQEVRDENEHDQLRYKVGAVNWREVPLSKLRAVWELVKPAPIEGKTLETKTL